MARRMTDRRSLRPDSSTALAAAVLFGVQSMVLALWVGAHGVPAEHDQFRNPLCIAWSAVRDAGEAPPGHAPLPNCCTLGCGMGNASLAPVRVALPVRVETAAPVVYGALAAPLGQAVDRASIRSRGPPRPA